MDIDQDLDVDVDREVGAGRGSWGLEAENSARRSHIKLGGV